MIVQNLQIFIKTYVEFRTGKNTKIEQRQTNQFSKRIGGNFTDLYKPVINKVATAEKQPVKYNFVGPLNTSSAEFKFFPVECR